MEYGERMDVSQTPLTGAWVQHLEEINKVGEARKSMLTHVTILPHWEEYHILDTHSWWNYGIQGIGYGFSRNKVAQLNRNGLNYIGNI